MTACLESLPRPGGDANSPSNNRDSRFSESDHFGFYIFAAYSGRVVLRNIFLDGNTFASRHNVNKEYFVDDWIIGTSALLDDFKFSYAQFFRSKEFQGQGGGSSFGSISVSYTFQITTENIDMSELGPLAQLVGDWEGDKGIDIAPAGSAASETGFREQITFEAISPVKNGPQLLYGLRYATIAWPLDDELPFHEEVGYWLWDASANQVTRCFIVPRGVTVNAGGQAQANATSFKLSAKVGSETFGILSSPFLDREFKTLRYDLQVTVHEDGRFSYAEDTILKITKMPDLFHHTDTNTLSRRR